MTRLMTADICEIAGNLKNYDRELVARTGFSLSAIACRAAEIDEAQIKKLLPKVHVGIIPISSGKGILGGFGDAVLNILLHMGCNAFLTRSTDVAGIAESFEKIADILMLADDERFVALHIRNQGIVDNAVCTGKAYATGLNLMTGGLKGRAVLVIGCGPVGCSATQSLIRMGARVSVYDIDIESSNELAAVIDHTFDTKIQVARTLDTALVRHKLIIDASPAPDIIQAHHITPETYVSAPGVPCGLDSEAKTKISERLLHDPLQLGVATMLVSAARYHFDSRQP